MDTGSNNNGVSTTTTTSTTTNDNLPTGSRLFDYMNAAAIRKSSNSSITAPAGNSTTPSPQQQQQFSSSRMSPYAAAFQPSSSSSKLNHYATTTQNTAIVSAARHTTAGLEERFTNALNIVDGYHAKFVTPLMPIGGQGNGILCGGGGGALPTPPDSSSAPDGLAARKVSKSSAVSSFSPPNIAAESIGGTTYFFNGPLAAAAAESRHAPYQQLPQEMAYQQQQHPDGRNNGEGGGNCYPIVAVPDVYAYNGPLPNVGRHVARGPVAAASYFAPEEIKTELMRRQLLCVTQVDPEKMPDLPQEVDCYHRLVPLEPLPPRMLPERPGYFGAVTSVYKAQSTKDGLAYCLRRVHNYRLTSARCLSVIDAWKKLQHSNVVQIREVFTTKAFGDASVVFVYDYYPTAVTLKTKHFVDGKDPNRAAGSAVNGDGSSSKGVSPLLPEASIWSYVVQLSSAIRQIHSMGLAVRTIDPTKILIMGKSRLLLNCCGLLDVLMFSQLQQHNVTTQHYQQDDLTNFGLIVLALACNNPMAVAQRDQWQASVDFVARNYSPDMKHLIQYLLQAQRLRNVNDVMPMIGARFYTLLEAAHNHIDVLENELTKEADNGRLFRLLCKLGAVNERPELSMDSHWSETGDRYLLKLFRDYLFHQVTDDGRPWLDLAHVVQCLNKLDVGTPEKIMLSSRDQQNVLIVTYADLRRCLDQSFQELLLRSSLSSSFNTTINGGGQQHPTILQQQQQGQQFIIDPNL